MVEVPPRSVDEPTVLITLTGPDRPGVSAALFGALGTTRARVIDVEQVVVRGHLTLAVLLATGGEAVERLEGPAVALASSLGMSVTVRTGRGDNATRPSGRLHVTVLASPLLPATVAAVADRIAAEGANIDRIRRLSRWPVTTVELDVSGGDVGALRAALAGVAVQHAVDIAVAPAGLVRRGRRLVVMDVDSTLIQDEVIELLAAHAGRAAEVADVTARAMAGELDFTQSLHERVACLAGLPVEVLARTRDAVRLTPGARTLVRTLTRLGFTVALVSGGFAEVVEPLAERLGIRLTRANRLEVEDGRLTGRVLGDVVDRAGKADALRQFALDEGLPLSRTIAVGDGANDVDMLVAAGLGIAFNAKPLVRAQADTSVTVPYLDSVLYLLGIPRQEIEEADAEDGITQHGHAVTWSEPLPR
ncbi:MAG TPA: phosphoserine phosphatase SerB [Actinomycetales bacterium]|nr:phosphoserine phosphatase SerB [Actinomycetales bacterium]